MQKILQFKSNNTKYNVQTVFDSLIYILKSGITWNSKILLNDNIVYCNSIYKHFVYLTKLNFFSKVLNKIRRHFFSDQINNSSFCSIDSTFICNKNCLLNNKIKRNPYKSNKFGYKISVITNQYNIPLNIFFANGNTHDLTILNKQLNKPIVHKYIKNKYLLADKGYKSKKLKHKLQEYNCDILLPNTKSFYPDKNLRFIYKKRIYIEQLFGKIKNYRRLANNYEKSITNFHSFVYLSLIQLYLVGYIGNNKY